MNIVTVDEITKAYGERKLFDKASFFLQEGEKAGIIGINGTGKSTLLKIIAGIENPDSGNVILANHYTVQYLPQTPEFEATDTVLQAVVRGHVTEENHWTIESEAKTMMTKLGITDLKRHADTYPEDSEKDWHSCLRCLQKQIYYSWMSRQTIWTARCQPG